MGQAYPQIPLRVRIVHGVHWFVSNNEFSLSRGILYTTLITAYVQVLLGTKFGDSKLHLLEPVTTIPPCSLHRRIR